MVVAMPVGAALLLTAVVTIVYQAIFYTICRVYRTGKLADLAGTTNFLVLALMTYILGGRTWRTGVLTLYTIMWSSRLGVFLLLRVLQWGHDRRYERLRDRGMEGLFWVVQGLWVWAVSLPVTIANTLATGVPFGLLDAIGGVVVVTAVVMEAVADMTKLRADRQAGPPWMSTGVWSWSRHPNYFFEICVWVGVVLAGWHSLGRLWLVAIVSPVFTALLLLFVSGVPVLEASADRRFGQRGDYLEYKKGTSVLIPVPPGVYKGLPDGVKKCLLLDFDMYNHVEEKARLVQTSTNSNSTSDE